MDPTGNITALVETETDITLQPSAAAGIMDRHPEVEQVGFVSYYDKAGLCPETPLIGKLRMAGGEFCGNAAMCAAALWAARRGDDSVEDPVTVLIDISGAARPVEVRLEKDADSQTPDSFSAAVKMPPALSIEQTEFTFNGISNTLPIVRMEGISHIIIESGSPFFTLSKNKASAEIVVHEWCELLGAAGLGLMFLENEPNLPDVISLTPLVYIPGSGTVFWENSCASGSAACGMYLATKQTGNAALTLEFDEPGGRLCVKSDPVSGGIELRGRVRPIGFFEL